MTVSFTSEKYDIATRTVDYARSDGKVCCVQAALPLGASTIPAIFAQLTADQMIVARRYRHGKNGAFLTFAFYEAGLAQKKSLLGRKYN